MTKFVILPLRILQIYLAIYVHYLWHCHFLGVYAERFLLSLRLSQWAVGTLCHSKCRQTTAHTMEKKKLCDFALMLLWRVPVSTVTCRGRSCMQRSHRSTLKLQSICYIFVVLPGVQRSYIWPARTWTWSTAQPWILVKLSHDHTCVSSDLHIHEFGLLHNGVHTWDYLLERWRCLFIGTRMELSISFIDLIHSSIQYMHTKVCRYALNDCMHSRVFKDDRSLCEHLTHSWYAHAFSH